MAVDWGRYELTLAATDGRYIATSVGFDAGWGAAGAGSETPDFLELSLDREAYAPGDTARARIVVPNAGQLLVAVDGRPADREPDAGGRGRRDGGRPARDRGLGRGRLRDGDADPADGRGRRPEPGAGDRPRLGAGRSGAAAPRRHLRGCRRGHAARRDRGGPEDRRPGPGRTRLRDHRCGRCRHPEPDRLRGAGSGRALFRPAPARRRDARRLRPADRRPAGHAGTAALGRRRGARLPGAAADRAAGRGLLRRPRGRRRGARPGAGGAAGLQRHGAADGGGLDRGRGRAGIEGLAGARPGGGPGEPPALPRARRHDAAQARPRPCHRAFG